MATMISLGEVNDLDTWFSLISMTTALFVKNKPNRLTERVLKLFLKKCLEILHNAV